MSIFDESQRFKKQNDNDNIRKTVCANRSGTEEHHLHRVLHVRRRMASAKKFDANWLLIGIPMAIVFLGWFMYESYQLHPDAFFNGLFWAGCIGGVIGAIWGFSLHFKTQRQYQDIIDQIEDLTAED